MAPLALHELNGLLGDDAFWTLLREYTSAERSSARHFVNLLRERRPGPDTEAYLDRWFR